MKGKIRELWNLIVYNYISYRSELVREQRVHPEHIPIIIINYNQLENLRNLLNFLTKRKFKHIVIIDNNSDYQPLLAYYTSIKDKVTLELMPKNYGHMVFFENKDLREKYGKGYFFLTDADIKPNSALPHDFAHKMIKIMDRYNSKISKVGFALDLDSIPNYYPLKEKVINWEKKFWDNTLEKDVFLALVDTTFALYKPSFPKKYKVKHNDFYNAVRIGGSFTCKHMGWYLDPKNLSEEQKHYLKTSSSSNSWKFNEKGELNSDSSY